MSIQITVISQWEVQVSDGFNNLFIDRDECLELREKLSEAINKLSVEV